MTLIKRTLLGFLLAGSLATVAGCSDEKKPMPMAEPDDEEDDDSDDFEDDEDDSTGEVMDAGKKSDAGKKDGGKDGGDGGKGSGTTVRGMDAGLDEEDPSTPRPQVGEVPTGPGTTTVTTAEGATIYLDKACPPVISVARNNPRFQGCCLPSGQCGATGYGAQDLNNVAFQCRPYEDPALANWIIPTSVPDEVASCTIPTQP